MTNNNNNNNKKVMTLRTVFKDVVRKEGVLALYRGVFARVLSVAPGSAISFLRAKIHSEKWCVRFRG